MHAWRSKDCSATNEDNDEQKWLIWLPASPLFGDAAAMRPWFANLITYSEALTLIGVYVPFTDIGGAVLRMLAGTRDITISDANAAELTNRVATMPLHPDVPAVLRLLRQLWRHRAEHVRDSRRERSQGSGELAHPLCAPFRPAATQIEDLLCEHPESRRSSSSWR